MATSTGKAEVRQFFARIHEDIEKKLVRGAARAAGRVIKDEAAARCISEDVRGSLKVRTKVEIGKVEARIATQGPGAYIAPWLEYGTDPHFISVDDSQRGGLSVRKVNERSKDGSLVIGGSFVGSTVFHPGARPHPFLRPALDSKEAEAIAAAQAYIDARVTPQGIVGNEEADEPQ